MFQAETFIEQIQNADRGIPRMEIMSNAIAEADAAAEHYWRIYFRYEYIKESNFHDDNFKAIIMFPTLLQIFDEHPELQDDTYDDVMRAFKWVLENMPEYYQISREEIEKYYDEYERRCTQFGFSKRVYYMKKSKFYLTIDTEQAKTAYQEFHHCKRDANSDCEACEINYDMNFALEMGDEAEALRIAAPILEGRKRCGEVPHVTYGELTRYYLYKGDLAEAEFYGRLCERYTRNEPEFLAESGYLLELYTVLNPPAGWRIFKANIENFVQCRNPIKKLFFAKGASRLLQCIAKETEYTKNVFFKALPLTCTEEGYRILDAAEYFYNTAKQQSEQLDQRNGTDYYMRRLEAVPPCADAEHAALEQKTVSVHGLIARIPCTLAAVPAGQERITLADRLKGLSEDVELISSTEDENGLFLTMRYGGRIYETALLWLEVSGQISARPCYNLDEETYNAMLSAKLHLLMQMESSDDVLGSRYLALHILHTLLPDMLGVIDVVAQTAFPAGWVAFAGTYPDAVKPADLFSLHIAGTDDSDEVWMTTHGLCTLGLRELEMVGANRQNFGYFADILHYTACGCAENAMLRDAGEYVTDIPMEEEMHMLTWVQPDTVLCKMPGTLAANTERTSPFGILMVLGEDDSTCLPTEFAPMAECKEVTLSGSHSNFMRRLRLSKDTLPCLRNALQYPMDQAAVRLEFLIPAEIREKCGYGKELLWAEIAKVEGDSIVAVLAEESEYLPNYHEGDEVTVTSDNLAGWFVRPQGADNAFTEEDAFIFM